MSKNDIVWCPECKDIPCACGENIGNLNETRCIKLLSWVLEHRTLDSRNRIMDILNKKL